MDTEDVQPVEEKPTLREKQIEQLAFYIANPKCLDLSDPGTGKTPPCCVYAYYVWDRLQKKTLWTMPKSLLKKNRKEILRFTDFAENEVAILRSDRADLTKNWTGPVLESYREQRGFKVRLAGTKTETDTVTLRGLSKETMWFSYEENGETKVLGKKNNGMEIKVEPVCGPDGKPQKMLVKKPEKYKDLIADAAQSGVKVIIATFNFGADHWQRIIENFPDLDLLLVDELHMPGGYSTPSSKATESFFWLNRHVSRFVGMTGTLINGRLDSAYAAISVIEPRYYGSLQGFLYEHAAVTDDYGRVLVWKNEPKLTAILARHSIRRTFEEVYGKEDVVFVTDVIEVHEKVRESYDKFHQQALLELENGDVLDGTLPGVALIRARQILAHPETMLTGIPEWTNKDERLRVDLMQGKKTLVFAALQPEQERCLKLAQELGLRAALINGNTLSNRREEIDEMAQQGLLDVIVASGPTAAVGYNWEMFDVVIFVSIDYLDVNILQAYRRASRGSRTSTLFVVFYKYEDSIDDRQYQIVRAKSELANRVDSTRPILEFSNG